MTRKLSVISVLWLVGSVLAASTPDVITVIEGGAAPANVSALDRPNDAGEGLQVHWSHSTEIGFDVVGYEVLASTSYDGPFVALTAVAPSATKAVITSIEDFRFEPGKNNYIKVVALDSTIIAVPDTLAGDSIAVKFVSKLRRSESAVFGPIATKASWFNWNRVNILILIVVFFGLVNLMVYKMRHGGALHFRRIAGIDAIDEAIGRATELGKPVLYVPGTQDIENIQTIASVQLLTSVATKAASYDIPIIVPLNRAFMVGIAEESVRQGFLNAGRPDAYVRDNIRYLSDEQFAFTSGVTGIMLRQKTAAHFFLGSFFAESLILSETGFLTGAIQIAGTANVHQLPFFVVACDYTLIGEEYFATSALVTRDTEALGTLKATDYIKAILIVCLAASMVLEMFGIQFLRGWFSVI
ncbi:fibronectin type III domain-containing protein [bacterium]|nr:fibronectin type III domain-containing protein [bacterium]MBU1921240.1 fibronectin type III domain-containing protein [bacterium]